MSDLETTGVSSIFIVIRSAATLVRMLPNLDLSCEEKTTRWQWNSHWLIVQAELLKLQKNGQLPDESVRVKDTQLHYGNTQVIKEIVVGGLLL